MELRTLEKTLELQGFFRIAGIDEAGRGPLAGPVVAAAVQTLPTEFSSQISDSKLLSPKKREIAYEEILKTCSVGIGTASVEEIDEFNILQATFLAMRRAIENLPEEPEICLVDGPMIIPSLLIPQEAIVKGDQLSLSIAAASIIAKVERDKIMENYDQIYPDYNFAQNKGYGTKEHREAIKEHGICPIHRSSFKCVS